MEGQYFWGQWVGGKPYFLTSVILTFLLNIISLLFLLPWKTQFFVCIYSHRLFSVIWIFLNFLCSRIKEIYIHPSAFSGSHFYITITSISNSNRWTILLIQKYHTKMLLNTTSWGQPHVLGPLLSPMGLISEK